jgi:hypothetical protein
MHLVLGAALGRERRQRLAELDQIAVPVLPVLEIGEVLFDFGEGLRRAHGR